MEYRMNSSNFGRSCRLVLIRSVFAFAIATALCMPTRVATSVARAADAPPPTRDAQQRIGQLIEQLGDPSFIQREAAKAELEKFGLLAFESLRAAELHANVEIAHSATYLLESMQVDWSLPSDSFEVQRLLKDYNEMQLRNKIDALQRLARLERADACVALLRLMRYEKDEKISKSAGLYVMENAIDALHSEDGTKSTIPWKLLITEGATESSRATAAWLLTLADQLDAATIPVDVWQKHISQERMLLESNSRGRSPSRTKTDDEIVKRLYRVVAKLMIAKNQTAAALDFFEPCLDLVAKDAFNDLQWMLEAGLPQAISRLNELRPELFTRTRNRFVLAEAYLKQNQKELANKTALEASNLTKTSTEQVRRIAQANPGDSEAIQRQSNFDYLVRRGLFEWAEAELTRILAAVDVKGELSVMLELSTRQRLANHYWTGDQPELAASVWQPIMQRAGYLGNQPAESINKDLQSELMQRNSDEVPFAKYIPSHYYFYLGLAASRKKDWALARQHLAKAAESDASDPDLLIAMFRAIQGDDEFSKLGRSINRPTGIQLSHRTGKEQKAN